MGIEKPKTLSLEWASQRNGPFDGVVGFDQGGEFIAQAPQAYPMLAGTL